jgi:hypothetical protein
MPHARGDRAEGAGVGESVRFLRTERHEGGASEVLTVCRLGRRYVVQVTTGPEIGEDFVGLYDLDGERINLAHGQTWSVARRVPTRVADAVSGWDLGGEYYVERL